MGLVFQTCVCIFYPDGNSGIDYHSDKTAFGDTAIIPSISLGEERQFCLREKKNMSTTKLILKHGSLLVMKDGCQERFEHSLPTDVKYLKPRINLTFRKYGF
ncbi:alpha-ketoglutarate-dependent dioxygenase AlkB [Maribacter sp. CXY002]|uniref:alpha-ketoglutarate-dependent dioxygenase AlkB n=1 Tax=Maribacter luteocoastalis TaxID=3407671 RepID=UPI003B66F3EE